MKIIKEFNADEVVYDNLKDTQKEQTIYSLNGNIRVDFQSIIDTQFTGGNVGADFNQVKTFLNLGLYSKAPCGGFPNFYRIESETDKMFIIYSGVNEVSNSHYIVTLHKILEE